MPKVVKGTIAGAPSEPPTYMVYGIATGGRITFLAAQELGKGDGLIYVKDLASPAPNQNGIGYCFTAVTMTDQPTLYESALLLKEEMPAELIPFFQRHQELRERERLARPVRKE